MREGERTGQEVCGEKNGSSGRTRTYNPPVNSPVGCCQIRNLAAQMTIRGNPKNQPVTIGTFFRDPYLTHVLSVQMRGQTPAIQHSVKGGYFVPVSSSCIAVENFPPLFGSIRSACARRPSAPSFEFIVRRRFAYLRHSNRLDVPSYGGSLLKNCRVPENAFL